jgi:hypothetical protein
MSWSTIRSGVKTKLETLKTSGSIGNILDYVFWTDDWNTVYSVFGDGNGRINFWSFGLNSFPARVVTAGQVTDVYTINMFGFYSIKTANESSKSMEDIVIEIRDLFSTSKNVLSLPGVTNSAPNLVGIDNTVYVETPAHRAQMQMVVTEMLDQELKCKG